MVTEGWGRGGTEGWRGLQRVGGEHSRRFARLMGNRWKDFVSVLTAAGGEIINGACHPSLSAASVKFHHTLNNTSHHPPPKKR